MTSKTKKIYIVLAVLATAAYLGDRLLLQSTPTPAVAADDATSIAEAAGAAGDAAGDAPPIPEVPFPANVPEMQPEDAVRDLFAIPAEAITAAPREAPTDNAATEVSGRIDGTTCSEFAKRRALQGVLTSDGVRRAVLGGAFVEVDQIIDGCTVLAIAPREVRVRCTDGEVVLTLPDPGRFNR